MTKLSLLLKVLEGETRETLQRQLFARERALPDLGNNIKCGNSLIAPDFYDGRQLGMFDEEERYRINAFDWQREFPHIFASSDANGPPGFDAIIGNPPYIRIQTLSDVSPGQADYIKRHYLSASSGNFDIYVAFLERGQGLLSRSGRLGLIVPSKFLSTDYGMPLRGVLAERRSLEHLVDFGHSQVFPTATTYTCLVFLDRSASQSCRYLRIAPDLLSVHANEGTRLVSLTSLGPEPWLFADETTELLINKLGSHAAPLLEVPASMSRGTSTGADDVFCLLEDAGALKTKEGEAVEVEPDILRKPIYATDFTRYCFRPENNHRIIFPYHVSAGGYDLISESDMKTRYPKTYAYLRSRRRRLESRKQWRQWYGFSAPRNLQVHDTAHFIVPLLADRGLAAPMPDPASQFCLMASGGFSISVHCSDLHPHYVLALVNSRPLYWNLQLISNKFRGGWITCTKQYFGTLPIRLLDTSDPTDKKQHDCVVQLVEHLLNLHRQVQQARTVHEQTALRRQIESTDAEIDRLVYNLYGLAEDEIRIVEEAGAQ